MTIFIERYNASTIKVHCNDEAIREDLYYYFRFKDPNYNEYWNKKRWDGIVRLFDKRTNTLPYGLLQILLTFLKDREVEYELDDRFKNDITNVSKQELFDWVKELDLVSNHKKIEPYDYQLESLYLTVKFNRMTILAATSAGKSLIIYLLCRYYEMFDDNLKTLVIVPSINLVSQLFNDFIDYSENNRWQVNKFVHTICEGATRHSNKPIFISTWQSLKDQDPEYFEQFRSCDL